MLKELLRAVVEDISNLPWKRWGVVGGIWLLLSGAIIQCNGWFNMIELWSFPWRTMPYVQIHWALFPPPTSVFSTVAGLWSVGYLMIMANQMARDI